MVSLFEGLTGVNTAPPSVGLGLPIRALLIPVTDQHHFHRGHVLDNAADVPLRFGQTTFLIRDIGAGKFQIRPEGVVAVPVRFTGANRPGIVNVNLPESAIWHGGPEDVPVLVVQLPSGYRHSTGEDRCLVLERPVNHLVPVEAGIPCIERQGFTNEVIAAMQVDDDIPGRHLVHLAHRIPGPGQRPQRRSRGPGLASSPSGATWKSAPGKEAAAAESIRTIAIGIFIIRSLVWVSSYCWIILCALGLFIPEIFFITNRRPVLKYPPG